MSSVYASAAQTALRLIKAKGFEGTLRHFVNPTRDRLGGDTISNDGHTDYVVDCAVFPDKAKGDGAKPNTRERAQRRSLVVAGATCPIVPLEDDLLLVVEGVGPWRVETVTPLGPDGQAAILFKLLISR